MPATETNSEPTFAGPEAARCILTINGGSSSIKFAVFDPAVSHKRRLSGRIDRIGEPQAVLRTDGPDGRVTDEPLDSALTHAQAAEHLIRWLQRRIGPGALAGIGHRVVHGGIHAVEHQLVTPALLAELRRTQPLDLAHLPREISLIEAFRRHFPHVPQVACFDTAFHRNLPRVAQLLPIPRRYYETGVRRFGFHGLSYTYLMAELERVAGPRAAHGRVILAHLGAGASMAAVHRGQPIDTSMAFTPTAGLVMGTRPGDLDPGLLVYLMRVQGMSPEAADEFISHRCGLVGVSEMTADMRELVELRGSDPRAAEAVDLFCYQAKKWIGAYAAALGGLDTLIFAGGIGERAPEVRAAICAGLEFIGLRLDAARNAVNAPVISPDDARATIRVMHTDEEVVIARAVREVIAQSAVATAATVE